MIFSIRFIQLIISISILIIVHELGHLIFAKLFNVKVEKFFLFFDLWFPLFQKKIGETIYGIGWIPLGGYVKISGMIPSEESNFKFINKQEKFFSKSPIKRFFIIAGGVILNIIFSIIVFSFLISYYGEDHIYINNLKYGIEIDNIGKKIGLKNGDYILYINNNKIHYLDEIYNKIVLGNVIVIKRNGKLKKIILDYDKKKLLFNNKNNGYIIIPRVPSIIDNVVNHSQADISGLKKDDKIISINNHTVYFRDQLIDFLSKHNNKILNIKINRNGNFLEKKIVYEKQEYNRNIGVLLKDFINMNMLHINNITYSFPKNFVFGFKKTCYIINQQIVFLQNVFSIETQAYKQVGSILSMSQIFPVTWNIKIFLIITATLSVWIAFLNILPIPSLDGGYLLFIVLEVIIGKKLSEKISEKATSIGFIIVSILMLIVIIWDIIKLFFKH